MEITATIILSVLLGGSMCINIASSAQRKRLNQRIASLKDKKHESDMERERRKVRYSILSFSEGCCSVYRVSYTTDGAPLYYTLIKTFDTNDAEYNYNEAVELKDNLEKELCYD